MRQNCVLETTTRSELQLRTQGLQWSRDLVPKLVLLRWGWEFIKPLLVYPQS